METQIAHLSSDLSSALFELENHYYQSKWRLPPDANSAATIHTANGADTA